MLGLSGFELYSRWVPLDPVDYHGNQQPTKRFQFWNSRRISGRRFSPPSEERSEYRKCVFCSQAIQLFASVVLIARIAWQLKGISIYERFDCLSAHFDIMIQDDLGDGDGFGRLPYIIYWHLKQGNPRQPWMLNSRLWILGSRGSLILSVEIGFWILLEQNYGFQSRRFYGFHSKNFPILESGLPCEGSKPRVKEKWVNKSSPWKCNFGGILWLHGLKGKPSSYIFIKYHFIFYQVP